MNLKENIFEFILKRQGARQVKMPVWKNVHSIAILHQHANIQHIIKELSKDGKKVVAYDMPDKKDICWLSDRPKGKVRDMITTNQYDLLIDLTQQPSLTMQYMALYIKAGFKTGRHLRDGIHDLTIKTAAQDKPDYLFEQIMRYIRMFGG